MPGEPRTGRGRASRERIVERAAELFAERGVAGTSLDDVLAAAGAGKSQLYHYFSGREELEEAAVGRRCTQVLAGLTQALGSVASLAGLEQALAGFVAGFEHRACQGARSGRWLPRWPSATRARGCRPPPGSMPGSSCSQTRWNGCGTGGAAPGRLARRAGHGTAGQHRGGDDAEPGAQGPGVFAYCGGSGARAGANVPELTLYYPVQLLLASNCTIRYSLRRLLP